MKSCKVCEHWNDCGVSMGSAECQARLQQDREDDVAETNREALAASPGLGWLADLLGDGR